jgi:hypothetical protein
MHTPFTLSTLAASLIHGLALVTTIPVAATERPLASQASTAQPSGARFDNEVRGDFFAGFSGQPERLARGMARAEEVLAVTPDQAEALVWHGAGLLFKSGQAFQGGDTAAGMELFGRGLGEMNKAVALAPDRVGVRVPRGAALLESTRFMAQAQAEPLLKLAVADYEHVLQLQAPVFASLGGHARGELLFGLADGYARLGDQVKARAFFERMTKEGSASPRREYAAAWLRDAAPQRVPACGPCHAN